MGIFGRKSGRTPDPKRHRAGGELGSVEKLGKGEGTRDSKAPADSPISLENSDVNGEPGVDRHLPAVSRERIENWLRDSQTLYFTDSEGDVGLVMSNRQAYLLLMGPDDELLQVRMQWDRHAGIDRLPQILEVCNDWNTERIWPKVYYRVLDNGTIVLQAETVSFLSYGVSDEQLDQYLHCGISTAHAFFDHLDELFPDPLWSAS